MENTYSQVLENLLVAQMAIEGKFEQPTINFFRKIYPHLLRMKTLTTSQMADAVGYTAEAAHWHRDLLVKHGYLKRVNYRAWRLNVDALHHPLLTVVLSLNVKVYKENGKYYGVEQSMPMQQAQA